MVFVEFKFWLRETMLENKWTQDTLGKEVGVAQVTIGQWAKGNNLPDPKTLSRLAKVTNTDEVELFKMVGYLSEEAGSNGVKKLPPIIEAAVREMEGISEDGIRLIIDQMRHVLKKRYPRGKNEAKK